MKRTLKFAFVLFMLFISIAGLWYTRQDLQDQNYTAYTVVAYFVLQFIFVLSALWLILEVRSILED